MVGESKWNLRQRERERERNDSLKGCFPPSAGGESVNERWSVRDFLGPLRGADALFLKGSSSYRRIPPSFPLLAPPPIPDRIALSSYIDLVVASSSVLPLSLPLRTFSSARIIHSQRNHKEATPKTTPPLINTIVVAPCGSKGPGLPPHSRVTKKPFRSPTSCC